VSSGRSSHEFKNLEKGTPVDGEQDAPRYNCLRERIGERRTREDGSGTY